MEKNSLENVRVGFCMTGSFCTFEKAFTQLEYIASLGAEIVPVMSENASSTDTRFGKAEEHIERMEKITGRKVIRTIADAEPIGPKGMTDVMVVAPCTGCTIAKLVNSITDTAVTMAVKSHLRQLKPVIIAVSTNDALSGTFKNIGQLMNMKHYYFVPFRQDDCVKKPNSLVADFTLIPLSVICSLDGRQLQPVIIG